jgi:hypothetical protein
MYFSRRVNRNWSGGRRRFVKRRGGYGFRGLNRRRGSKFGGVGRRARNCGIKRGQWMGGWK